MKRIFSLATAIIAVACAMTINAQEPDLATIALQRQNKADSIATMMGTVYGLQAAMTHPSAAERQEVLKGFNEAMGIDDKEENFKEGNTIASEFFKVAGDMKNRTGIIMNRKEFAQAVLSRYNDTTVTKNINQEVQEINTEARRLIEELTALHKDSAALTQNAGIIALKSDSLSRNMGQFYGMQMAHLAKQQNKTIEQQALMLEGFNNAINIDDSNKPLIDGKTMGNDLLNLKQNIKKQVELNLDKDKLVNAVCAALNDPKVPTQEEFNAENDKTIAYVQQAQQFARETTSEAMMQKGLGQKYIAKLLEKDPGYIQAPSGLVYKIINPGNGKKFNADDKIKVIYKGTHVDGTTFDESKEPVTFAPSQVVPGFREALLMMSPGAKMIAVLPQELAYGARGAGQSIKPFETLTFEIETQGLDETAAKDVKATAKPVPSETKNETAKSSKNIKKAATKKATTKKKTAKRK